MRESGDFEAKVRLFRRLPARERLVLKLICEDKTNGQIALVLKRTEATVARHITTLYKVLGLPSEREALRQQYGPVIEYFEANPDAFTESEPTPTVPTRGPVSRRVAGTAAGLLVGVVLLLLYGPSIVSQITRAPGNNTSESGQSVPTSAPTRLSQTSAGLATPCPAYDRIPPFFAGDRKDRGFEQWGYAASEGTLAQDVRKSQFPFIERIEMNNTTAEVASKGQYVTIWVGSAYRC